MAQSSHPSCSDPSSASESGSSIALLRAGGRAAGDAGGSGQDLADDAGGLAVDERAVAVGTLEDEGAGVEAEEMEQGGVVVGVRHDPVDGLVAEVVGSPVHVPALHTPPRHPGVEAE